MGNAGGRSQSIRFTDIVADGRVFVNVQTAKRFFRFPGKISFSAPAGPAGSWKNRHTPRYVGRLSDVDAGLFSQCGTVLRHNQLVVNSFFGEELCMCAEFGQPAMIQHQ